MSDNTLKERMRKRRQAIENTMMSDVGSYTSDIEDRTLARFPTEETVIATHTPTMIQSLDDNVEDLEHEEGNMLEALQTRRQKRQKELQDDVQDISHTPLRPTEAPGWTTSTPFPEGGQRSSKKPPLPRIITSSEDSPGAQGDTTLPGPSRERRGHLPKLDPSQRRSSGDPNLNASIRERMRNKVKGLHSRAGAPSHGEDMGDRKLRGLRERPLPSRFEEGQAAGPSVRDEQDEQLQASIETAKKWKKARAKAKTADGFPTEEEAFNFFVGNIEEEDKVVEPKPEEPQNEDETIIDVFEDNSLLQWLKPEYLPNRNQLEVESERYGYPSTFSASVEDKVPRGAVPRSLEDEGFYVGQPPPASVKAVSLLENRILLSKKEKYEWFGKDGVLVRLPDPLREKPTRPPLVSKEDMDVASLTEWGKAELGLHENRYIDGTSGKHYQIDVDVSSITFTHHPLFSKEHVLAVKLQQLYNQYYLRNNRGLKKHLNDKLYALRIALKQVDEDSTAVNTNRKGKLSTRSANKRIAEYKAEIREVRRQRDDEEFKDEMLLKNILDCWRGIKMIREKQGYTNTPVTLKIRRQVTNKEEEEIQIKTDIEEEMSELRDVYDEEYKEKHSKYEAQMLEWKKQMKLMKKRRQQMLEQSQRDPTLARELDEENKPVRPEPPPDFDEAAALDSIYERLNRRLRKPGHPILIPEVQTVATVTPTEQCPRGEQMRRADIKSAKYYIKVLFNDVEVSRTGTRSLTSEFTVHFGEILSIRILQWPESLKFQIVDASSWPNSLMADLYSPIPEASMVSGTVELEHFEFSCDQTIVHKHDGVGSGVMVYFDLVNDPEGIPPVNVLTSGILYSCTAWALDDHGNPLVPPSNQATSNAALSAARQHDALVALGAAGMIDMNRLLSWLDKVKFDPNDPANANLLDVVKYANISKGGTSAPQYFRLDQLKAETDFATDEDLDNNKRFKLIRLRDKGVPEFKNMKMIPSDEKYLKDNVFDAYEKRLEGEQEEEQEQGREAHRAMITKFLTQVRQEVLARTQAAKSKLDLKDIVIEDEVPDIGTLGARIGQLFAQRRPLKPIRRERKRVGGQNLATVKDVSILINIVRAFDVPVRSEPTKDPSSRTRTQQIRSDQSMSSSRGTGMFSASGRTLQGGHPSQATMQSQQQAPNALAPIISFETLVSPFVEVTFQGRLARTSVADGPVPNWNEDLVLPFKAPNNDYSAENLQTVRDKIYIHLYDEIRIDTLEDERQRGTTIQQRIEKYWLGGVEIPFSTVYFNSKVEGFLHVSTPPVLLGYEKSQTSRVLGFSSVRNETVSVKGHTYIQAFLTLEPQLQPPQPMAEVFETNEDDTLVHNSQVWLNTVRKQFPERHYKTMVSDLNGKKVFVTRYIRAQKPPDGLIPDPNMPLKQSMRLLARFVSLIPYISDSVQFPDLCDIWTTSEQFLRMLAGDEEEHAVLLCNYFLYMKKKAWVVLGYGIPEGQTAYVLTQESSSYLLWNAVTSEYYHISDQRCPLQSIGCLIDENNILANVQKDDKPCKLLMSLEDAKSWRPFFSKNFQHPGLSSVQVENPRYYPLDQQLAINLEDKIERHLRDLFMDWRPKSVTRWNRYTNQAFRNLLANIEPKVAIGSRPDDHRAELEQILSSSKLTGFPIQMPFTDLQTITNTVQSTGVHLCENPNAEFALAVHVHPYPNSVMVVWVYLGIIAKPSSRT